MTAVFPGTINATTELNVNLCTTLTLEGDVINKGNKKSVKTKNRSTILVVSTQKSETPDNTG
jgi:hypothetical protein